jgi:hypothetical protein
MLGARKYLDRLDTNGAAGQLASAAKEPETSVFPA